jgi:hypothetical protein
VSSSALAAAGLLVEIVGAMVLGSAVFLRRSEQILEEASPKWNFNAELHASLARQTADAQVGLALLIVGFAAQFTAALGVNPSGPWAWAVAGYLFSITVVGALLVLSEGLRPRYVRTAVLKQLERSDVNIWWLVLRAYGRQLNRYRSANQAWGDFGLALLGSAAWDRLVRGLKLPPSLLDPAYIDPVQDTNEFQAFQG